MEPTHQNEVKRISEETLDVFETISSAVSTHLREPHSTGPAALASINTFTSQAAVGRLTGIDSDRRQNLESLAREPAIARIVTRSGEGKITAYYICRTTPHGELAPGNKLAGRNSPSGRLASLLATSLISLLLVAGSKARSLRRLFCIRFSTMATGTLAIPF
jgi:hypothetical protein